MKHTFYYACITSCEKSLEQQLEAFDKLGAHGQEIVIDKESNKGLNRPGYQTLKTAMLHPGDTLIVKSLAQLGCNKNDIKNELKFFKGSGIHLKVIDLPATMLNLPEEQAWVLKMINNILIEFPDTITEQEFETIRRQWKRNSAIKFRKKHPDRSSTQKPANWNKVIALWRSGEITVKEARQQLKMKKKAFYKALEESYDE